MPYLVSKDFAELNDKVHVQCCSGISGGCHATTGPRSEFSCIEQQALPLQRLELRPLGHEARSQSLYRLHWKYKGKEGKVAPLLN
jgi:hypothetical protein